jgi:hypothetical protein
MNEHHLYHIIITNCKGSECVNQMALANCHYNTIQKAGNEVIAIS